MSKTKTVVLTDGHLLNPDGREGWQVEQIGDTIEFRTGQFLNKDQVAALCRSTEWKVTIKRRPR